MKVTKTIKGVVAELNGMYFGTEWEDAKSTSYTFGPLENAKIADPEYCINPEDMTYQNSPYYNQLKQSKLIPVTKTITWEV